MPNLVQLICPALRGSRQGNRVSAERYRGILLKLGFRVRVDTEYDSEDPDLLIALHASKSARSARAFRRRHPDRPLVVVLTGTDLYEDLQRNEATRRSIELADRLVLLQPAGRKLLSSRGQRKARVIYQSVELPRPSPRRVPRGRAFQVCVVGHLRPVKDPFRAAMAVRRLPESSSLRVMHLGQALEPGMVKRARAEAMRNPRYQWLGDRPRRATLAWMARSHLLVHPSRAEGGANVIGEAAALGLPILASRIDGNSGLLGDRHPGLFPTGDTLALRALLLRAESDVVFYRRLGKASRRVAPLFKPARERGAWRDLLRELGL